MSYFLTVKTTPCPESSISLQWGDLPAAGCEVHECGAGRGGGGRRNKDSGGGTGRRCRRGIAVAVGDLGFVSLHFNIRPLKEGNKYGQSSWFLTVPSFFLESGGQSGAEHGHLGLVGKFERIGTADEVNEVPGEVLLPLAEDGVQVLGSASGVWVPKGPSEAIGEVGDCGIGGVDSADLFERVP